MTESLVIIAPLLTRVIELKRASPNYVIHHIRLEALKVDISRVGEQFFETRGSPEVRHIQMYQLSQTSGRTQGKTSWNKLANKEATIYLENAEHCVVHDCEITNAGYNGINTEPAHAT